MVKAKSEQLFAYKRIDSGDYSGGITNCDRNECHSNPKLNSDGSLQFNCYDLSDRLKNCLKLFRF